MIVTSSSLKVYIGRSSSRAGYFAALLQEFYQDLLEQGVPEQLAALVKRLPGDDTSDLVEHRGTAIIVESDDEVRALAAALLEETDLAVVECTNAEQALAVLRREGDRISFIFADEHLAGGRGGADLARSAKALSPHVHVVVTSTQPERLADLPAGVRALRKPWRSLDVLEEAERASLSGPARARA